MELTDERREYIDSLSIYQLLSRWRYSPTGDLMFQGESGRYWKERMAKIRESNNSEYVMASKILSN